MATLENGPTSEKAALIVKTPAKLTEKEKAKLLSVAKYGPDHIPPKSGVELEQFKYHYVSRVQEMSTVWGNRIGVIIFDDNKEFCVYLGDTEKQKERYQALLDLTKVPGYSLQMCLESVEQRSGEKARPVPHYDFRLVEQDPLTESERVPIAEDNSKEGGDDMVIDGK